MDESHKEFILDLLNLYGFDLNIDDPVFIHFYDCIGEDYDFRERDFEFFFKGFGKGLNQE